MTILLIAQGVMMMLLGGLSILGPLVMFTAASPEVLGLLRLVGFTYLFISMLSFFVLKQQPQSLLFGRTVFLLFHAAFSCAHFVNSMSFGLSFKPAIVHIVFMMFFLLKKPSHD